MKRLVGILLESEAVERVVVLIRPRVLLSGRLLLYVGRSERGNGVLKSLKFFWYDLSPYEPEFELNRELLELLRLRF